MSEHQSPPISWIESLSKMTAAIVATTYISGFLVVSIHNAAFGLSTLNPLKPKILTAGAWFLLLVFLPALSAPSFFGHALTLTPRERFSRASVAALSYCLVCNLIASTLSFFLFDFPPTIASRYPPKWQLFLLGLVVLFGLGAIVVKELGSKHYRKRPILVGLLALAVLAAMIVILGLTSRQFSLAWVTGWFFGIGIVAVILDYARKQGGDRWSRWPSGAGLLLAVFTIFALEFYPNIKSSLGGGSPVPVVIYFSNDSRTLPGQELAAELLEESDNGVYIVQHDQKSALFLPRNTISAVYFSKMPLDGKLLTKSGK